MVKLVPGVQVRVLRSLLYTSRTGALAPTSGESDDFWDFYVHLDASEDAPARTIGVMRDQVAAV